MNHRIINNCLLFILFGGVLSACKSNNNDLLYKKWKTVSFNNQKMAEQIIQMRAYIDTIGDNDPELRKENNIDSLKFLLKQDLEKSLEDQKVALENTFMEFQKNGLAITTSIEGVDSAMFTREDNFIKIDESKLKGYGETMTFEILSLTKDTMHLKLIDYGDTSIAIMVPAK